MIGTNGRNFIGNEHDRRSLSGTETSYNCYPVYENSHNGSQILSPSSYHSSSNLNLPPTAPQQVNHQAAHNSPVTHHHVPSHVHSLSPSPAPIISEQAIQRLHSLIIEFVRARNPPLNTYHELGQCLEYMYKKTTSEDSGSLNDFLQTLSRIQYYCSEKMLQEKVNRFNGIINTLKQAAQLANKQETFRQLEFISRSLLSVESELSATFNPTTLRDQQAADHQQNLSSMGMDPMRRHNPAFSGGRSGNMMSNLMNDLQLRDDYTGTRFHPFFHKFF